MPTNDTQRTDLTAQDGTSTQTESREPLTPDTRVLISDRGDHFHIPRGGAEILGECGTVIPTGAATTLVEALEDGRSRCERCDWSGFYVPDARDATDDATAESRAATDGGTVISGAGDGDGGS